MLSSTPKKGAHRPLGDFIYQTYIIALPIILTALMGYIVWLLKNQKKDRDANRKKQGAEIAPYVLC